MTGYRAVLLGSSYHRSSKYFLSQKGPRESVVLERPSGQDPTTFSDLTLMTSDGETVRGLIRLPRSPGRHRAALLVVGIETGREAVRLIEGFEDIVFVALDYPSERAPRWLGWPGLSALSNLRRTAARMIPLLLQCLDWMFEQPFVDATEVNVIAVSLGTFTGIPAAVVDQRVKQLVVVQGGGDLSMVITRNAEVLGTSVWPWLAGIFGRMMLSPFEPTLYIPHLAPRPLLMINGEGDSFFPRRSAEALYGAAREPKEIVWHDTAHIMPEEQERVRRLTLEIADRLYGGSKDFKQEARR